MGVYFGPSNPQLQEVRRQIAAIREQIEAGRKSLNDKLQAEYEHAVLDEESLKAALAQAKAEAVNENQAAIQYNVLKQEVDTAKALYTEFLQKSNQSKIQAAEQYSNIRMIDHAKVPLHAYGPRRALIILLWFTISLVVGIGSALLLEYFDNSLKNGEDVTRFLQLSTLASIPRSKTISDGLAAGTETYHALRTSLLHSTEGPPKTILVTSIEPGDGKTTTTINLALSFSELGLRVLVIDGDMRHPTLHQAFGLEQHLGLSTYLSEEMSVNQLIYCPGKPNLSLLLGGPIPHPQNPANLIGSAKMKQLLDDLSQQYDQILIDSTEIGSVTDPAILSTMVDGVLLVVNAARNRSEIVRRAKYDLMNVGARILGVVLNQVDPRQTTDDK
jgi:capsular exopolysaccharide synthesis family protein